MRHYTAQIIAAVLLVLCTVTASHAKDPLRILILGDSFMTSHSQAKQSVAHHLEKAFGAYVKNRAITGARYRYFLPITGALGLNISKQYREGPWDWVIINGGGNDMWMGCGCTKCARRMDKLISADGTGGDIPTLVAKARRSGAKVAYVGYLRSPGTWSPIEHCKDEGDTLEARIAAMAQRDHGVIFISLADLVPTGDKSFHAADMIHPSVKGTRAAADRIAQVLKRH
ncbi:Lysophospholipase L1 [Sulfitobacter marinus]|uniref:Lysophospholipase L1 n=1 Tax=Sulfitobacter marinus TaxID=394264 RepID=A0A1I6V039_9RHOB|nr:SGNH/GDSL hydrolase family protein [Sulfitobacter marinus]SFT07013.1 Lysophospholipase L1 [Sulfitobacter marinus]